MHRAFLRTPVEFTRVSSRFNPNRRHPVLNTIRAHKGVDYAAPTGTPVRAAGDGRVSFAGQKGGYGNVLEIAHTRGVVTVYGHLPGSERRSHRLEALRRAKSSPTSACTGLATGPHLHYEYRVNGVHKNPQTVSCPAPRRSIRHGVRTSKTQTALALAALEALAGPALVSADRRAERRSSAGVISLSYGRADMRWPIPRLAPWITGPQDAGVLHQPRAVAARIQPARARAGARQTVPLLERLRFLCISSSNLDEFFEIRVAGLKQLLELGSGPHGAGGLSIPEQLGAIHERAQRLVARAVPLLNECCCRHCARRASACSTATSGAPELAHWLEQYFEREVEPVLSPLGLDPARPFPRILNKSLNFIVRLQGKDAFGRDSELAIVQAPRSLPRVIPLPPRGGQPARSCCCRPSCTRSCTSCSPAWKCSAAISSASRATATCSSTRKRSTTCGARSKASSRIAVTARPCAWRPRATARKT